MLRAALLSFVAAVLVPTLAGQAPLGSGSHGKAEYQLTILGNEDITQWSFNELPDPNATDHLVFETVHSLLQHWPNTRMRNGHNIVPGSIPKGTLFYHGTDKKMLPPGPDWVSTDPEHSYGFCQVINQQGCWHLTIATTRPLKVIYFDGSSAAKIPYGSLDTQDLIAWGRCGDGDMPEEWPRIQDLCKWGGRFGVDGFVRMEMDFEVMLCDFTTGVHVVSFLNVVNQVNEPIVFTSPAVFEVMNAGSWHNRFPGETRIQLDLTGLVSFYDTELVPSLVGIRADQERWDHRAGNVSSEDLSAVRSRLEAALIRPDVPSSGVDWKTLIQVVVDRYAQRLELTRYLLNSLATDPDETIDLANKTQTQLRIMLTPYLLLTAIPANQSNKADLDWAIPIYKPCATTHILWVESELGSITDSEKLLLQAIRGTSREICRVVTKMWGAGVHAGIDRFLNAKEYLDIVEISHLRATWAQDLNRLMTWLDWSVWVKCNPGCGAEEMCYLPTWPVDFPLEPIPFPPHPGTPHSEGTTNFALRAAVTQKLAEGMWNTMESDPDEWIRPQPKCVRRVDPYGF